MADLELYGHPFRAIWQQLAGDLGITTARMRQNVLDEQADQEAQLRDANIAIADAMQGGDAEQNATLAQMMRDRAQTASQNIAALQRGGAPQQTANPAALVAPFYQEREQGRIASDIDARNKAFEIAKQRRDEFHNEITSTQSKVDSAQADANTVLKLLNDLGSDSDIVQSRFRDFMGMSLGDTKEGAEALGSIGAHGLGHLDIAALLGITNQKKPGYDVIVKAVGAVLGAQTQAAQAKIAALQQHAVAAGYSIDPETGGLQDLNVPQYTQGTVPVRAPNASDVITSPPSLAQHIGTDTAIGRGIGDVAGAAGSVVGRLIANGGTLGNSLDADVAQHIAALSPEQRSALAIMQAQQAKRRQRQRPVNP